MGLRDPSKSLRHAFFILFGCVYVCVFSGSVQAPMSTSTQTLVVYLCLCVCYVDECTYTSRRIRKWRKGVLLKQLRCVALSLVCHAWLLASCSHFAPEEDGEAEMLGAFRWMTNHWGETISRLSCSGRLDDCLFLFEDLQLFVPI